MSDERGYRIFQQAITAYDAPAFVRRARDVEYAWTLLVANCQKTRHKLLEMPRMRLAIFFKSIPPATEILPQLIDREDMDYLRRLDQEWSPTLRVTVDPVRSNRQLARLLSELRESLERFNRRWSEYLNAINLSEINRLRENYNRYYVLEKECAILSSEVAQLSFVPMSPAVIADLYDIFPLLTVPRILTR